MNVQTYLFFPGTCREAIQLYSEAIKAELLHLTRFSEAPGPLPDSVRGEWIYHSTIKVGDTLLNLSDDPQRNPKFSGFVLLVHFDNSQDLDFALQVLAEAGRIDLSAQEVFWAARYAIVTDRFGITWKLQYSEND